jgi:AcrR family transcriptional regulator
MPRVTQEHRDARRRQILDAARDRFARDGFHRTSMDDVIAAAGLSAGAVYGYFPSKTALVHATVADALDEVATVLERMPTITAPGPDDGHAPLPGPAALGAMLDSALEVFSARGVDATRIALFAWAESMSDDALRELVADRVRGLRSRVREVLVAAGQPADDVAAAAVAVLASQVGFILQHHVVGDVDGDVLARGMSTLVRAWSAPAG